ncbi:MAG: lipopolysaccharide assembly protein LapB [Pseudomonadota bacterium]|nr:lipopolysaccharide assembly protein LapB [Pseudomonadota bacterium]
MPVDLPVVTLFLLLPVAALSGWMIARRHGRSETEPSHRLASDYLEGMNYLINEQQDKAIEVFIRLAEVDNDTVDTHMALGTLFRRRGEVERAIRIHQNLIARPTLRGQYRDRALFELAQDYLKAGLLDRAEALLLELTEGRPKSDDALRLLLQIYEQERDWTQAVEIARSLKDADREQTQQLIAQYCCELAESAISAGEVQRAERLLRQALSADRHCVRVSMLRGRVAADRGDFRQAIRHYKAVLDQDVRFSGEIVETVRQCYGRLGDFRGETRFIQELADKIRPIKPAGAVSSFDARFADPSELKSDFARFVANKPDVEGLAGFVDSWRKRGVDDDEELVRLVHEGLIGIVEQRDHFKCQNCGFSGRTLHWQCPSCKQWNTVIPTQAYLQGYSRVPGLS